MLVKARESSLPDLRKFLQKQTFAVALRLFPIYAQRFLKIIDKLGRSIPLELNSSQRIILRTIIREVEAGRPPRLVVLKARQTGVSTLTEALLFYFTDVFDNRSSLVVAHNEKSTRALFRMSRFFYESLPKDDRHKKKQNTTKEIHFDKNNSRLQVETVGEVRGYTAQFFHGSEVAFWEDDANAFRAIMQVIPMNVESLALLESTANGAGGTFYRVFATAAQRQKNAEVSAEEQGWVPIFIPWYKHEEYRSDAKWVKGLTPEEKDLQKRFGLDLEQIAWRRRCIATNVESRNDSFDFDVEYPATAEDAFRQSGSPVFEPKRIESYRRRVPPNIPWSSYPKPAEIEWDQTTFKPKIIEEVERGRLRIFEPFRPRHSYIIGADPSEGDAKSDGSPLEVLDQMSLNFVAEWDGRVPPEELAQIALWLGLYYGGRTGMVINEANNHGISFHNTYLDLAEKHGPEAPSLYMRETSESIDGKLLTKPGFFTTERSKHALVNTFRRYSRLGPERWQLGKGNTFRIYSPALIDEMDTFVYVQKEGQRKRHPQARDGYPDDKVIAAALCLWCHQGSEEAPLEPLPEAEMRAHVEEFRRIRERDREGSERYVVDVVGKTCDEWIDDMEVVRAREAARQRNGIGRMN